MCFSAKHPILTNFCLLISLFFIALSTQAKVYKWTDENGKVHYSDKPVDNKSQQIKMERQPTNDEVIAAKKRASSLIKHQNKIQSIADDEAQDKQIADEKNVKQQNEYIKACSEAKHLIRVYSSGRPIYTTDQKGKKSFKSYTDEQKNKMIADLQKVVNKTCAGT